MNNFINHYASIFLIIVNGSHFLVDYLHFTDDLKEANINQVTVVH